MRAVVMRIQEGPSIDEVVEEAAALRLVDTEGKLLCRGMLICDNGCVNLYASVCCSAGRYADWVRTSTWGYGCGAGRRQ